MSKEVRRGHAFTYKYTLALNPPAGDLVKLTVCCVRIDTRVNTNYTKSGLTTDARWLYLGLSRPLCLDQE